MELRQARSVRGGRAFVITVQHELRQTGPLAFADRSMEVISYHAIEASSLLAEERGTEASVRSHFQSLKTLHDLPVTRGPDGKYRFEATLTSQLGVLPSYTALGMASLQYLARLYWYTVEFGLARERTGVGGDGGHLRGGRCSARRAAPGGVHARALVPRKPHPDERARGQRLSAPR